jgi:hypothetical protein
MDGHVLRIVGMLTEQKIRQIRPWFENSGSISRELGDTAPGQNVRVPNE